MAPSPTDCRACFEKPSSNRVKQSPLISCHVCLSGRWLHPLLRQIISSWCSPQGRSRGSKWSRGSVTPSFPLRSPMEEPRLHLEPRLHPIKPPDLPFRSQGGPRIPGDREPDPTRTARFSVREPQGLRPTQVGQVRGGAVTLHRIPVKRTPRDPCPSTNPEQRCSNRLRKKQ